MKKLRLAAILACCAVLLASCAQEQETFPVATDIPTQNLYSTKTTAAPAEEETEETAAYDYDSGEYDPSSEEGNETGEVIDIPLTVTTAPTAAPTVRSEYAGATPVAIDPIDKPTATPLPALTLADAVTYEATRLHLSFSAPGGWVVDDADSSTYIITNPDTSMAFQASVTIRTSAVSSNYTTSMLKSEVSGMISTLKTDIGFKSFTAYSAAERTLMDKNGVYNDFYGTTNDGVEIYGRVHITCIEKTLYSVTILCPRGYWSTYKTQVYNKIRSTMMITQ